MSHGERNRLTRLRRRLEMANAPKADPTRHAVKDVAVALVRDRDDVTYPEFERAGVSRSYVRFLVKVGAIRRVGVAVFGERLSLP